MGQKRPRRSSVRESLTAMNVSDVKRSWLPPLIYLSYNVLTFVGLFLVNAAAVSWLFVLPVAAQEAAQHPYLLVFFLGILPAAFLLGVLLMPAGIYLRFKRQSKEGIQAREFAPLGWENREFRRTASFIVLATGCNVLVGGYFSQRTVHFMDSAGFCSTTCHSMSPEYAAYQESAHFNIACVQCHIGSGRRAYMGAKLNGLRQVTATVFRNYPKPIPTPLENLRPAREICESCHWPRKFSGVQLRVFDHFAADSANSHTQTVLALSVGGGPVATGIHGFHVAPGIAIEFATDPARREIYWVRYIDAQGSATEYAVAGWDAAKREQVEFRTMDCLDCHTRPSHRFQLPERALDEAMALGTVDRKLPWIKQKGLEILRTANDNGDAAHLNIAAALTRFYETEFAGVYRSRTEAVESTATQLAAIYNRNVFPDMGVSWGTYPDNSGHSDFVGCFRCHGSAMRSEDGRSITRDCTACHRILALREAEPDILEQLGIRQ